MTQNTSQLRDLFLESEKRKFNELHQALLVDNGVGSLLNEMKRINQELGLLDEDNSSDEKDQSIVRTTTPKLNVDSKATLTHKKSQK